jgi:hypothetical protein
VVEDVAMDDELADVPVIVGAGAHLVVILDENRIPECVVQAAILVL